jgi:hypothetical protein
MCKCGVHCLAASYVEATPFRTWCSLKMATAKTDSLTKEMHLGNVEQQPIVLIFIFIITFKS